MRTPPSSARACWSTWARWWRPGSRRSRCRSRCARSATACSRSSPPTRPPDPPVTAMAPQVILGVSAGIAAYKACELLRRLTESGHRVRVIPTPDALRFVGEPTWAALVVVAPATADLLARAAAGRADDLLTATLLTARCPVLYAPAMHTEMWEH